MKAIVLKQYGSVDNFALADIPIPPVKAGEVRIRTKAVSFNPVDYQIRKGLPESKMVTSNILGRDLSGVVDEVGEGVTEFRNGDEVYCYVCHLASSGTYAEYISAPQEIIAKKPVTLSHEEAAAIPVAGITAAIAIAKSKAERSKSLFIAGGAGGVGSFAIIFANLLGIEKLITTAGNEKSFTYLLQHFHLKPEQIINYRLVDFVQKAVEQNAGYFDVALDLVGGNMLAACCTLLSIDGHLASIVDAPGQESFDILFHKNASFHSVGANAYSLATDREQWRTYQRVLNYITRLYDSGVITMIPAINIVGEFSADTVKKAHQLLESGTVQGKLVMCC